MDDRSWRWLAVRGRPILIVAATYAYFLIFAQFGFLHRITEKIGSEHWNEVLGLMAMMGIGFSLWTGFRIHRDTTKGYLLVGFMGASLASLLAMRADSLPLFCLAGSLGGASLGVLTVAVVGALEKYCPAEGVGMVSGLGTGMAYFFCNIPHVFEGSPLAQCGLGALVGLFGLAIVLGWRLPTGLNEEQGESKLESSIGWGWVRYLLVFLLLIGVDSAAFTRIQDTPELLALSWSGTGRLWMIGWTHALAAILGGWMLDRGCQKVVYSLAFAFLAIGFLGISRLGGGWGFVLLYASGVSLYSTALVAFALKVSFAVRPTVAVALVYGVAGWIGSGLGIGMVQDLGLIPPPFWWIVALLMGLVLFVPGRKVAV